MEFTAKKCIIKMEISRSENMSNSILKEEYLKAEIEVITFGSEDVIVTSTREYIGPYIPIDDGE